MNVGNMRSKGHRTNRSKKRNRSVIVDGKRVTVKEYLRSLAKTLPDFSTSTKQIDHYQGLKKQFQKDGMVGVERYLKGCDGVILKDNQRKLSMQRDIIASEGAKKYTSKWKRTRLYAILWFRSVRLWIKRSLMNWSGRIID